MSSGEPAGILFDLDDTLIAYDAVAEDSWRTVCAGLFDDMSVSRDVLATIRRVRAWYWSDPDRHRAGRRDLQAARLKIVSFALSEIGISVDNLASKIVDSYAVTRDRNVHLFPKAREALQFFVERQIPLVLVTNGTKKGQRAKIERFELEGYFDEILIEGEMGFGKPDPRVYKKALGFLGALPSTVWSVGDNLEWDVFAPQRLGKRGIWHDHASRGLPASSPEKPSRVINRVHELTFTE